MPHTITDRCDGCSACLRQCPTQAIAGQFKQRFRINPDRCIDCGVCGLVCARGSVVDEHGQALSHVPRPQRPRPLVDPALCNGCFRCVEECPFEARSAVGRQYFGVSFLLNPQRCTSCGECEFTCAKGAISMEAFDLRRYDEKSEQQRLQAVVEKDS